MTTVDTPGAADAVVLSGAYAYVADSEAGLQVIDLSVTKPGNPRIVGTVNTPGHASSVAVLGTHTRTSRTASPVCR